MPIWLLALLGVGATGAVYYVAKAPASATAKTSNAATSVGMNNVATTNAVGAQHIHLALNLPASELDALALSALLNPNTTQAARDVWLLFTAENPYFSQGTPASKALGWG